MMALIALKLISVDPDKETDLDLATIIMKLKEPSRIPKDPPSRIQLGKQEIKPLHKPERNLLKKKVSLIRVPQTRLQVDDDKRRVGLPMPLDTLNRQIDFIGRCVTSKFVRISTSLINKTPRPNIAKIAVKGMIIGVAFMIVSSLFKRGVTCHIRNIVVSTISLIIISVVTEIFVGSIAPDSDYHERPLSGLSLFSYAFLSPDQDRLSGLITSLGYYHLASLFDPF